MLFSFFCAMLIQSRNEMSGLMSKNLRASLCALLAAFFWGSTFVAQDLAAKTVGPFTYTASRSWVGAFLLLILSLLLRKKTAIPTNHRSTYRRDLLLGGLACGAAMTIAANLQQAGIGDTDPGKAGFITSLYVVLVPIFGLFCHRRASIVVWISTAIALVGLYLLCVTETLTIQFSDLLILLCAVFFAVQILLIDRLPHIHGMHLCCVQLFVVAAVSTVLALVFERPTLSQIFDAWGPILYSAVFSSALAYTLQIVAQKDSNPTVITLLLCLESVFAVLCDLVILGNIPSIREAIGCLLMFGAVILANLPIPCKKRRGCEQVQ